jgi:hypothetical protein
MSRRFLFYTAFIVLSPLLLSGCPNTPTAIQTPATNNPPTITNVNVPETPTSTTRTSREYPIPNCNSTSVYTVSLESYSDISEKANVSAFAKTEGGVSIPIEPAIKLQLDAGVGTEVVKELNKRQVLTFKKDILIPAGQSWILTINSDALEYSSTFTFNLGSEPLTATYTYAVTIPSEGPHTLDPSCPTQLSPTTPPKELPANARDLIEEISWRLNDINYQVDKDSNIYPNISANTYVVIGYRINGVIGLKEKFKGESLASLIQSLSDLKPKIDLREITSHVDTLEKTFFDEHQQDPQTLEIVFNDPDKFHNIIKQLNEDQKIIDSLLDTDNW